MNAIKLEHQIEHENDWQTLSETQERCQCDKLENYFTEQNNQFQKLIRTYKSDFGKETWKIKEISSTANRFCKNSVFVIWNILGSHS